MPVLRNLDRGMRPAKDIQSVPRGNSNTRTRGVQKTIVTPLSALAENFIPQKTSRKQSTPQMPTDNELDRSFAKTGSKKKETPHDSIENNIATIVAAYPTEIGKPVAVADVAGSSGPAVTGTGGPVVAGTRFLAVTEITGASGSTGTGGPVVTGMRFRTVTDVAEACGPAATGAGGPVVAGTQFLAVAEVHVPFEKTEGDLQGDRGEVDQNSKIPEEDTGSHLLEHSGVVEGTEVSDGVRKRNIPDRLEIYTDPGPVRKTSEEESIEYSAPSGSLNEWSEPFNTDGTEDTEDGDAIMVGVVGSAAPWFITGWTNDVEVEFMIDTGCQVTILATSVFEKMCKSIRK